MTQDAFRSVPIPTVRPLSLLPTVSVRSWYGHILVIAYGFGSQPVGYTGICFGLVGPSRPSPNYSRFGLDPSGLLSFRHKRPSSISTDCTRGLPA
jgi:hypothetical protein